jgi:hypothetical protein
MRFIKINTDNFKLSTCSCWHWCKNYKCKHLIDLCSRLDYITYDSKVQSIPIGRNRVRGRPSSTKGALEYQPCEEQGVFSADSDNENEQQEKSIKKKGRKKKKKQEDTTDESEESDFDIFDPNVACTSKQANKACTSKQPDKASTSKSITSNDENDPICQKCNSKMTKKRFFYCPKGCSKK